MKKLTIHLLLAWFSLTLVGYSTANSSGLEKYEDDANKFGAFIGSYGLWSAYITAGSAERKGSSCLLVHNRKDEGKVLAEFEYGNKQDYRKQLGRTKNYKFVGENFDKTKELLKQLCVLENSDYSIQYANPDFVLCARDEPNARVVLWDFPAVRKEGFFSVENKVVDGIVFVKGNGYRSDYYYTDSGWKGDRYLDMYVSGSKKIYTQILIGYAKSQLWYASGDKCDRLIEVSACRGNFDKNEYDPKLFNTILNAADGLWSQQFCKGEQLSSVSYIKVAH